MRHVAIIGAGAAGTMAAIFAAAAGARVTLLERTQDGGRKILISGGGRCNVLPVDVDVRRFVTDSPPRILRDILRSWPLPDQIRFFEHEVGIPLIEEAESRKLFPASNRARDIRDGLLAIAAERGVTFLGGSSVTDLTRSGGGWRVHVQTTPSLDADAVVLATGGLSVPATGSDGAGIEIAKRLGHVVRPTYAALTPLLCEPPVFAELAGVSLDVRITAKRESQHARATGGFLFTHRGYSGPAVLDISHLAVRSLDAGAPARIGVRWTPLATREWDAALRPQGTRTALAVLRTHMPDRLAAALLRQADVDQTQTLATFRREDRLRLIDTLIDGVLPWTGHEGYRKAEVTGGGVDLGEVDPRTLESRRASGLFLCGEMLDAFGPIGGYNFLWAWVTGRAAGMGAAASAL
jgi:predicted Rossmann fold flavoprotein